MTQVIHLTTNRAEASVLILAAHAAKTLPAQNGLSGTYFARENGKVCRCAIGVLYPAADAEELEGDGADAPGTNYLMARALIAQGLLIVPREEREWFTDIQGAHDDWTIYFEREGHADAERRFLELLQ